MIAKLFLLRFALLNCLRSDPSHRNTFSKHFIKFQATRSSQSPGFPSSPDLENFLKDLLVGVPMDKLVYSSNCNYGGHISNEFFDYDGRDSESEEIVAHMSKRKDDRADLDSVQQDKLKNPLIVLPGSPGAGKTTFLAHFAEHSLYSKFVEDSDLVLVSTLTFNSAMNEGETAFGLRIIFGLLKSMGLLYPRPTLLLWGNFYRHFIAYKLLSGLESILLINFVFTESYPGVKIRYLILVDEIAKAKERALESGMKNVHRQPFVVVSQIGALLDELGNVDIIVSSLSPKFIDDMVTTSTRPIKYVIPKPLQGYPLGIDNYNKWVSRLCALVPKSSRNIDETHVKIMKNFYLLYSGHPRSLEQLSKICNDTNTDWTSIIQELTPKKKKSSQESYCMFLERLSNSIRLKRTNPVIYTTKDAKVIEQYILSSLPVDLTDKKARKLVESNKLMLFKAYYQNQFVFMSQTDALLMWFLQNADVKFSSKLSKLRQVQKLTSRFRNLSIAELWEYCIGISIVSHSYDHYLLDHIFGLSHFTGSLTSRPKFKVHLDQNTTNVVLNTLYMSKSRQPGFDLRVVIKDGVDGPIRHLYIQCKVDLPEKQSLSAILANVVYYSVRHFLDDANGTQLDELHIGLYVWADLDKATTIALTKKSIIEELQLIKLKELQHERLVSLREEGANKEKIDDLKDVLVNDAISFVNEYWDNIHLAEKNDIKEWLLPSFLSIPELVKALD